MQNSDTIAILVPHIHPYASVILHRHTNTFGRIYLSNPLSNQHLAPWVNEEKNGAKTPWYLIMLQIRVEKREALKPKKIGNFAQKNSINQILQEKELYFLNVAYIRKNLVNWKYLVNGDQKKMRKLRGNTENSKNYAGMMRSSFTAGMKKIKGAIIGFRNIFLFRVRDVEESSVCRAERDVCRADMVVESGRTWMGEHDRWLEWSRNDYQAQNNESSGQWDACFPVGVVKITPAWA